MRPEAEERLLRAEQKLGPRRMAAPPSLRDEERKPAEGRLCPRPVRKSFESSANSATALRPSTATVWRGLALRLLRPRRCARGLRHRHRRRPGRSRGCLGRGSHHKRDHDGAFAPSQLPADAFLPLRSGTPRSFFRGPPQHRARGGARVKAEAQVHLTRADEVLKVAEEILRLGYVVSYWSGGT